jgi:hypothetical protein
MNRRPYQQTVLDEFIDADNRCWAMLWERQAGKSTTMAEFALHEMFKYPNRTVIYASASLLLAQEITLKTAIRANQTVTQAVEGDAAALKEFADTAQSTIDAQSQKPPKPRASVAPYINRLPKNKTLKPCRTFNHRTSFQCPVALTFPKWHPSFKPPKRSRPKSNSKPSTLRQAKKSSAAAARVPKTFPPQVLQNCFRSSVWNSGFITPRLPTPAPRSSRPISPRPVHGQAPSCSTKSPSSAICAN